MPTTRNWSHRMLIAGSSFLTANRRTPSSAGGGRLTGLPRILEFSLARQASLIASGDRSYVLDADNPQLSTALPSLFHIRLLDLSSGYRRQSSNGDGRRAF